MVYILPMRQDFFIHSCFALVKIHVSNILPHSRNKFHIQLQTIEYPLFIIQCIQSCTFRNTMLRTPLYKNETNLKELPHVTCLELLKHGKEALGLL